MSLSENNTRVIVTLSKVDKHRLKQICIKEKRSLSNLCSKIISDYLSEHRGDQ